LRLQQGASQKASLKTGEIIDRELPPDELAKLQPNASLDDYGKLTCNIYNGSSWDVKDIIIHVDVAPRPLTDADFLEKYGVKEPTPDQKNPFMDASPVPTGQQNPFMDASPSPTPSPAAAPTPSTQAPAPRIIQVPDGTVEFPAGMTEEQIQAVLRKEYPPKQPVASTGTGGDIFDQVAPTPSASPSKALTFDELGNVIPPAARSSPTPTTVSGRIVYDSPPPPISRDYRLTPEVEYTKPLEAGDFTSFTGIKLKPGQQWTWKIVSARGIQSKLKWGRKGKT